MRVSGLLAWVGSLWRFCRNHVDELSLIALGLMFFLVASNTQTGWVYLLSGAVLGTLITAAVASRRALRPEGFRLQWPAWCERGRAFPMTLTWQRAARPYAGFLACQQNAFVFDHQGRSQALLRPEEHSLQCSLLPRRRGCFDALEVELLCLGPLGWFSAVRRFRCPAGAELWVLPAILRLSRDRLSRLAGGEQGPRRGPPSTQGDLRRLREYRPGDDVRAIHWPTSARSGELVVRELSQGGGQELLLCWGCNPAVKGLPGAEEAFEWMLSWVHTFAFRGGQAGWRVQLLQASPRGGWQESQDLLLLAQTNLDSVGGDWSQRELQAGQAQVAFWLGDFPGPGQLDIYEFFPADFAADSPGTVTEATGRRVLPGQEPL